MIRICSKLGPRYPIYNDKRSRHKRKNYYHYYEYIPAFILNFSFGQGGNEPAPKQLTSPLPRPTIQTKHIIKQPKSSSGFVRGNRNIKKEINYASSN